MMKATCKTCPFGTNGDPGLRDVVSRRVLTEASQHCHGSGWPVATHLCRGARDLQLEVFHTLGVLAEPTDECWKTTYEMMK